MGQSGQSQTVTTEVDPAFRQRQLNLFGDAQRFLQGSQFQPFPGQQIAGQQPLQQGAQNFLSNALLGQNVGFQAPDSFAPFEGGGFQFTGGGHVPGSAQPRNPDDFPPDVGADGKDNNVDPDNILNVSRQGFDQQGLPAPDPFGAQPQKTGFGFLPPPVPDPFGTSTDPGFSPVGQAQNQQASGIATGVGGFSPQQVQGGQFTDQRLQELQNPFQQQVIDQSISDLDRARQLTLQSGVGSSGAGTFGGDRSAIRESEVNRNFLDQVGRTSAQLRSAGFDRSAGLAGQELGLGLQAGLANQGAGISGAGLNLGAANSLDRFGTSALNNTLSGASALNQFGTQNQNLAQSMINSEVGQFNQARNDPLRGFSLLQSILGGVPVGNAQTSFLPGNTGASIGGGALTGAGIGTGISPGIGTAIGGGLGGLFGLFG